MDEKLIIQLKRAAFIYELPAFLENDPSKYLRKWGNRENQEILGFISSWLAYGRREAIIQACEEIYQETLNLTPYFYVRNSGWRKWVGSDKPLYRFFTWGDFANLCNVMKYIYDNYPNMEEAMKRRYVDRGSESDYLQALIDLFPGVKGIPKDTSSACKRLNLFLRWMVRKKSPVDIGIWEYPDQSKLLIPLDTHVARIARELDLIEGERNNMRAVIALTHKLAEAFPNDPVQGDYALFGIGVSGLPNVSTGSDNWEGFDETPFEEVSATPEEKPLNDRDELPVNIEENGEED